MFEFFPMPDEMKEHLRQQADMQEMRMDSYRHDVQNLFEELGKDHLLTLRHVLHNLSLDESLRLAAYYEGVAAASLKQRFDVCPGCGVNHAEEMMKPDEEEEEEEEPEPEHPEDTEAVNAEYDRSSAFEPVRKDSETLPLDMIFGDLSDEDRRHMEEYHLDDLRDERTHKLLGFVCLNCGQQYPSIADRMLRRPDECSGCFQKAKFG